MKKLIMFSMVIAIAVPVFSGIASAQEWPVCFTICPMDAGLGDEVTMTGYDENGDFFDLSTLEVFESNFHHDVGGYYPTLVYVAPDYFENIAFQDGTVVFTLTDEMLMEDVFMWDFFCVPGGDPAAFRIVNRDDPEDAPWRTVVEAIEGGGTCGDLVELTDCGERSPIVIDPNVMLVHETGETEGDFGVSLLNEPEPEETVTVTVDPNEAAEDITIIGGDPCEGGTITLIFDANNFDIPQIIRFKAIDDVIAEPPELLETQRILVSSVYSGPIQDPNWAGEKVVEVDVMDNDQANMLFTISPIGQDNPKTPITGPVQIWEQPGYVFGSPYDKWKKIGVTLQVAPSGDPVKIEVTKDGDNPPIMDPPLTTTSEPNSLIFNAGNYNVSQDIKVWGNDDDVLQAEGAEAEGGQNYFGVLIFTVIDGGGDERYQWEEAILDDEGDPTGEFETVGLDRGLDFDIEDNECGAYGISYLDIGNPYYVMDEEALEAALGVHGDPNDWVDDDGNPLPDCYVNIYDILEFATKWLDCSDPQTDGCESYL